MGSEWCRLKCSRSHTREAVSSTLQRSQTRANERFYAGYFRTLYCCLKKKYKKKYGSDVSCPLLVLLYSEHWTVPARDSTEILLPEEEATPHLNGPHGQGPSPIPPTSFLTVTIAHPYKLLTGLTLNVRVVTMVPSSSSGSAHCAT